MPLALTSRLQVKHLRLVAAIDDLHQLSLAAQALGMTQPAASRALREIEAIVGAAVFERNPKGMAATAVGEGLARHARNVLDEMQEAAQEVERLLLGTGGIVRIGAVTGAAVGYAVPAIRRLKALAPMAELHVDVSTSDELVKGLVAMRYDMVLARLTPAAKPADFTLLPASGERVRFVASRRHRLAGLSGRSLVELAGTGWVIQGPGTPIRQALEHALLERGAPVPDNVVNTASLLVTLALLAEEDVVAPVSQEVAGLLVATQPGLVMLDIREPIAVSPYSLITLRGRRLSPAAVQCRNLLADMLRARRLGEEIVTG